MSKPEVRITVHDGLPQSTCVEMLIDDKWIDVTKELLIKSVEISDIRPDEFVTAKIEVCHVAYSVHTPDYSVEVDLDELLALDCSKEHLLRLRRKIDILLGDNLSSVESNTPLNHETCDSELCFEKPCSDGNSHYFHVVGCPTIEEYQK